MFGRQLNQMRIDLSITPVAPLLIRRGRTGADPTRPDLECVRTSVGGQPTVYIPGSSLKGVLRSHAERLLRSEDIPITPTFDRDAQRAFNQRSPSARVHSGTCPLGRTFGTLHLKGRVGVSDHVPGGHEPPGSEERQRQLALANAVEQRNGVGIDRLTGGARGGAIFDQELVIQGRFDGQILLRNVQLYQLALLLVLLRDLDEGYVLLGSGTTRGNGRVEAKIRRLVIETRGATATPRTLAGAGALLRDDEDHGLFSGDEMPLPEGLASVPRLLWQRLEVAAERVDDLAEALMAGPWHTFLEEAGAAGERRWTA